MPGQPVIHTALILANAIFGLGSIIGALGLPATNPLAFTFVREIVAGFLLLTLSSVVGQRQKTRDHGDDDDELVKKDNYYLVPQRAHVLSFMLLGFFLFVNQAAYIMGIELGGPVTGSVWQPSAPIFTAAISMASGMEDWSARRLVGVLVAFLGCAAMILLSDRANDTTHGGTAAFLLGNLMFFLNCFSTACYILFSKQLLCLYPSLTVTAWSYNLASPLMFLAALASSQLPAFEALICPACGSQGTFTIPRAALPALSYYIVAMSVGSWGLILWSNQ